MGKKPHLILALLALGFIQPALGQDGSVTFGNRDCGIWLQKDNDYLRMGTEGWLLGYLSGQNKVINTPRSKSKCNNFRKEIVHEKNLPTSAT